MYCVTRLSLVCRTFSCHSDIDRTSSGSSETLALLEEEEEEEEEESLLSAADWSERFIARQ